MSRQQQLHFMRQPYVRARAVAQVQEQNQHKITMMIAYALLSAIIVLWLAYLPTLTGSILTNLHIVPTHLSSASDSVNRTNMDNRRASARFDDRWNAFATPTKKRLTRTVSAPAPLTRRRTSGKFRSAAKRRSVSSS